ncbi:hypothetical protein A3C09_00645 [Candidatus Uhrbacteria bacterium RIFCSPHIGHO2_02_FULL_47_44]|uniref:AAA+ ATPase domain-containing protein n=1 Tax=Candidatus Uhrbacteria bacterium RIFCSPLOWO2_02_FULL_48_18 TaxID=1802408 RepID=A0A1F7V8D1_9BACT|nr:MAG: hypothetical protein A2839_04905 [Candidatus Uhrbacteria bacterium RIFCSPHIGHO2_01_FULL_47_10]OGL70846.1 MAG: hypothetical protein A3C09_00645 [Candidatus Uhrbacteria bacterium RIFCSPHIGHO2_02_FULL_47_44]OGL82605.1 MAG: hypothetical protein A3B20_00165 [Candidatus Uhrbacteria bacterium RIFCSPLOWO2_01_FULL_47_17]OGL86816.1 MAG: hypothetical protein A3I41_04535 [Candidatus Uhrbacteria bacterium RIFCSPLOWO2_02_FULL_48_18]OGL91748.1 MAG: hypothetical protein A3H12_00520 [Candidatus Uhrbacte
MYIKRNLEKVLKNHLFKQNVLVLYGPRQSGKTTLIKEVVREFGDQVKFLDCELMENKEILSFKSSEQLFSLVEGFKIVVFDEAQVIPNIGSVLKTLFDHRPEVQYIATGSSSFDLANKISEPLTGRSLEFILYPLSLAEVTNNAFDAKQYLFSLMRFGGYPHLVSENEDEKIIKIQTILSQYLFKNVLMIGGIKKPEIISQLLKLLAFQIGNEVSYRELSNQLKVNQQTVEHYIDLLEKNFIIFRLGAFSRNLRNEVTKTKKIYFVDLGIRNAIIDSLQPINITARNDIGALFENAMIIERMKHVANLGKFPRTKYFWRTFSQQEIDYLELQDGVMRAYEFKWNETKTSVVPKTFAQAYPDAVYSVITPVNAYEFITRNP